MMGKKDELHMKNYLFLFSLLISTHGFSQDLLEQATKPEYLVDENVEFSNDEMPAMMTLSFSPTHCKIQRDLRQQYSFPWPDDIGRQIRDNSELCYLSVDVNDDDQVTGFQLNNETKNHINPMTSENGSTRQYEFIFEERSRANIKISITDNSGLTGRMSHDLLHTDLTIIPRKTIPYVVNNEELKQKIVHLGTDEVVIFDGVQNTIVSGVLEEGPMDMEPSRHKRKFAPIKYTGKGIMIRADRRSGTPEHIYNTAYNVNENTKKAIITYQDKTCLIPKEKVYTNAKNPEVGTYLVYGSDKDMLDKVINPECGWSLTLEDISI
jgi:hypothetical protein